MLGANSVLRKQMPMDVMFPLDYSTTALREMPDSPKSVFGHFIQNGEMPIFESDSENALDLWEKQIRGGSIKKIYDISIGIPVLEITGKNSLSTFITSPVGMFQKLGIRLPYMIMLVKNLNRQFALDIQILDSKDERRRFRFSNRQGTTRIKPLLSYIPLRMEDGWNEIKFNLDDITAKIYGTKYKETLRVQIYTSCRLHKIYFTEKYTSEEDAFVRDVDEETRKAATQILKLYN